MNTKFRFAVGFVVIAWLLLVGTIAFGQPAPLPGSDNIVLSGVISCGADKAAPPFCPLNLHYVHFTAGRTYMIRMASSEFNARLMLEDLPGKLLARDDEASDALNGAIVFRPAETGRYRLIASALAPKEGFYTITIREMPILFGVEETLTANGPASYEVPLTAGRRYIIDLESAEFAPFVKLLNADGTMVAFEDERGPMGNTRIVFEPTTTQTYRLVAASFSAGATGTFRLTVCED
jgi:hypothetical protein